jgi:hypothetical protein
MARTTMTSFSQWVLDNAGIGADERNALQLDVVLDIFISRCEDARRRGSSDPLKTVSPKGSGGNSRMCTRRMLRNLGFTDAQLRVIHRLVAGSTSGWPGLLRLFVEGRSTTAEQRAYVRRQIRAFHGGAEHNGPHAVARRLTARRRAEGGAAGTARDATPRHRARRPEPRPSRRRTQHQDRPTHGDGRPRNQESPGD